MSTIDLCHQWEKLGEASSGVDFSATARNGRDGQWSLSTAVLGGLDALEFVDSTAVNWFDTIIVRRDDGKIIFFGELSPTKELAASTTTRFAGSGRLIESSGIDGFAALSSRICWPDPDEVPPWLVGYDVRTGTGAERVAALINANLGSTARIDRSWGAGVAVASVVAGASGTSSSRLQPLSGRVGDICNAAGVRCLARMDTPGVITYDISAPVDRSTDIILSDQGDLTNISVVSTPRTATYVIAAGQGELEARAFAFADSGEVGAARIERVIERTNITVTSELQDAADAELADAAASVSVQAELTPTALADAGLVWLDDFDIGDTIGARINGRAYTAVIEAVRITINETTDDAVPVLGRHSSDPAVQDARAIAALNAQQSNSHK